MGGYSARSETRRPGSGKTSSMGFTYYWSSMSTSRMEPSVVEVIPVDERIMRLRLKHSLVFMSTVPVHSCSGE